jgi:SAM-dependent methyltransferase
MDERHSYKTLVQLSIYTEFLESIAAVADIGCGNGKDIEFFATLIRKDKPFIPYNFKCYAVDKNPHALDMVPNLKNIFKLNKDFSDQYIFPVSIDLMLAHDVLQYSISPLQTLKNWNEAMTVNGMLLVTVPTHVGVANNRFYSRTHDLSYYNFTVPNLIYMLAVNGFDCRDAYLLKKYGDPWIQMAVYKSDIPPMDPSTTTWQDLIDKKLIHFSIEQSYRDNGYVRQEDICMPWLDRSIYYVDYIQQWTEIPAEAGEPRIEGVFNTTQESKANTIIQGPQAIRSTNLFEPVELMKTPKKRLVKDKK